MTEPKVGVLISPRDRVTSVILALSQPVCHSMCGYKLTTWTDGHWGEKQMQVRLCERGLRSSVSAWLVLNACTWTLCMFEYAYRKLFFLINIIFKYLVCFLANSNEGNTSFTFFFFMFTPNTIFLPFQNSSGLLFQFDHNMLCFLFDHQLKMSYVLSPQSWFPEGVSSILN